MSYSCTSSRGSSQEPSGAQRAAAHQPAGDGGGADGSETQAAAMRVRKGCSAAGVGVPVTTEEDLLASTVITPEDVLGLQKITESKWTAISFYLFFFSFSFSCGCSETLFKDPTPTSRPPPLAFKHTRVTFPDITFIRSEISQEVKVRKPNPASHSPYLVLVQQGIW